MVDFNNEVTVGTPALEVERISILQRRYDFIEAFETYKKQRLSNIQASLSVVRARLISLFIEVQAILKRQKGKDYEEFKKSILGADKEEDILNLIENLNDFFDLIKLTKIDTITPYKEEETETEDELKGYG